MSEEEEEEEEEEEDDDDDDGPGFTAIVAFTQSTLNSIQQTTMFILKHTYTYMYQLLLLIGHALLPFALAYLSV
jgi:hypothetical protein